MLAVTIAAISLVLLGSCSDGSDNPKITNTVTSQGESTQSPQQPTQPPPPSTVEPAASPVALQISVLEERDHDPKAFTQGLEFDDGRLYESRGRNGESGISEIDPRDGSVLRWTSLGDEYFGEGVTVVGDSLIQLTWLAGKAFVYDIESFEVTGSFDYEGQGWGLCFDGVRLVMSDGSSSLTMRDPETFTVVDSVPVRLDGSSVASLNELECVNGKVYANIWQTETIVEINPSTGDVTAVINASGLLDDSNRAGADVLNGIAYDEASGAFLLTGKLWPSMFVVVFEPS